MRSRTLLLLAIAALTVLSGCRNEKPGSGGSAEAGKPGAGETGAGKQSASEKPDQPPAPDEEPIFVDITNEVGLKFEHTVGHTGSYFFPQIAASGGAFLDYDRDGRLDIYLINGNLEHDGDSPGETVTNKLFHQKPDGTFEDVTEQSGLGDSAYGLGVAVGDVNNDGLPDVYVTNYGPDRLYVNRGDGRFEDVTAVAGIDNVRWGSSACFFDYDRDGRLDLFITNYINHQPGRKCESGDGHQDFCGPSAFAGTIDKLYHNVSTGEKVAFEDVTADSGIGSQRGPGLGVVAADFTGDGFADVYVANDGAANFLWVNQQDGTFVDDAIIKGVSHDSQGRAQAGMGIAMADIDGDLRLDLFVTHLDGESNALYGSGGDAFSFRDLAVSEGLGVASFPMTGFGTAFFDVECDGDLDLAVANGRVVRSEFRAMSSVAEFWKDYEEHNQLFINQNGAFRLRHSTRDPLTSQKDVSRGLCVGDIDNDGDPDLLITNAAGPARLYRNDAQKRGHWLLLRVIDPSLGSRDAYGARVVLVSGEQKWLGLVQPGSSYLSSHDPRVHFGLGDTEKLDRVEVTWPDGTAEIFDGPSPDQQVTLRKGEGRTQ